MTRCSSQRFNEIMTVQNTAKSNKIFLTPPLAEEPVEENSWIIGMWLFPGQNQENLSGSFKVLSYHWDNRSQLESDAMLIRAQIANLKNSLYPILNKLHEANHSERYWDVLLGEWIYGYVQIFFDRWRIIETMSQEIESPNFMNPNQGRNRIPFDTQCFLRSAKTDHNWNANLFIEISRETYSALSLNFM
jgi:putative transferase (TIGR04331 family)